VVVATDDVEEVVRVALDCEGTVETRDVKLDVVPDEPKELVVGAVEEEDEEDDP